MSAVCRPVVVLRASTFSTGRLDSICADPHEQTASLYLHYGDVTGSGLRHVIEKVPPQEIYNLAAQSHVRVSFQQLVHRMVDHDLELARQEQTLSRAGHKVVVRGSSHG